MKTFMALLAIATLALAACGSSDDNTSSASSSSSAGGAYGGNSSTKTTASSSGSSTNEVEMYDNYFKPKTISGKAGSTVKIELKNEGNNEHNFKIDGQKADADVEPGKNASVSVVIPKSGSVQFYCEYHKGLGMVGTVKPS
ncbi:MAG TPA: cupredoxin domain-containing protein [Thermoleophilaceae bacterium]